MKLHYIEEGTGEPMVLLHGNGEDHTYFEWQIRYFSQNYRVIAVDTRGHGKSPRGVSAFTLKQFAVDLKKLLEQLGLSRVILLGFSDGGNIALIFALRYPEMVDHLILNGANLNPFGMRKCVLVPICMEYVGVSLMCAARNAGKMLGVLKRSGRASGREGGGRSWERKKELLGLMVKEPRIPAERLRQIPVPTLVIAGTEDMIREAHTRKIHEMIPGSRLKLIEGDHFIAKKESRAFNRAVNHFINTTAGEWGR